MRKDLEARVIEKLRTIGADDMQRLAEDYVRIRYPDRFSRLDFRALSPEGRSRGGWPDAFVLLLDGRIDRVEATTLKEASKIWGHLAEDAVKARNGRPKLAGFVFVSGEPSVQPTADELEKRRSNFASIAGIPLDSVDLVFAVAWHVNWPAPSSPELALRF